MIDEVIGIGCDWGTTSLRAYLLGRDAQIIEKIEAQKGIMSVKDGDFEKVFDELGLKKHMSPSRVNGIYALKERVLDIVEKSIG